jgi:hypothetical protein
MKSLKLSVVNQTFSSYLLKSIKSIELKKFASASALPIFFLFWVLIISLHKPNIPIMDDYDAILDFLIKWQENDKNKFLLLLSPHNEHPLAIPKLIILGQFKLFGIVDFRILTAVAQLLLVILSLVILKVQAKIQLQKSYNLVYLLILNLGLGTVLVWPMAGLQHISTVLFSTITFYLFSADLRHLSFIKWLTLYATAFTGGASLLILIVLLGSQIFLKGPHLRWLIVHMSIIVAIYIKIVKAQVSPNIDIDRIITLFLHFMGNPFSKFHGELFGVALIMVIVVNYKKFFKPKQLMFTQLLIFNASMGFSVAISRNSMGAAYGDEEKYFLYSVMCWLVVLLVLSQGTLKRIKLQIPAYSIALLIFVLTIQGKYQPISNILKIDSVIYPVEMETNAHRILQDSRRLSIYEGGVKMTHY